MRLQWRVCLLVLGAVAAAVVVARWRLPRRPSVELLEAARPLSRRPRIHPDYCDLVIPPNIAPLNFRIDESGELFFVRVHDLE